MADKCHFWQVGCKLQNAADDQITQWVKSLADAGLEFLKVMNTFWLNAPSPTVQDNTVIDTLHNNLHWFTAAFAVVGLLFALGKIGFTRQIRAGGKGLQMVVHLVLVQGVSAALVTTLIKATDDFSPWIVNKVTGQDLDLSQVLSTELIMLPGIGPGMMMALFGFIGSIANLVLMIVRAVIISLIFVFLPSLAAASESEMGDQAYRKAQGWLWAFLLYKPVAAVIYAFGLLALQGEPIKDLNTAGSALMQTTEGVATLCMAGLALPAIIKAIVPVAGQGVSGMFSGGAIAAGAVATGAAIVTLGGSAAVGGAAAAGGAASSAAGAAGSAGSAGAAAGATPSPAAAAVSAGSAGGSSSGGGSAASGSQSTTASSSGSSSGQGQQPGGSTSTGGQSTGGSSTPSGSPASSGGAGPSGASGRDGKDGSSGTSGVDLGALAQGASGAAGAMNSAVEGEDR